jgi:hypothetical protein
VRRSEKAMDYLSVFLHHIKQLEARKTALFTSKTGPQTNGYKRKQLLNI